MAHALRSGTAWDRTKEDYAYTRELDSTGWAWEFLRRNETYQRDFRMNRAGHPVAIQHVSGATLYRPRRRFLAAEEWGLELFADPEMTALDADIFWLPDRTKHAVHCNCNCNCKPTNDNSSGAIALSDFRGRRAVLAGLVHEQVKVSATQLSVSMIVGAGTMLFGATTVTFLHDGLDGAAHHLERLHVLKTLATNGGCKDRRMPPGDSKLLPYLIALDGYLQKKTAREIAEVLYGTRYVRENWAIHTFWLKSRVRRAIHRGRELMAKDYRRLL